MWRKSSREMERELGGVSETYEAVGSNIEEAVAAALAKIPFKKGKDFVQCRVVDWGYQRGGFADSKVFWAVVAESDGTFKT